MGGGGIYGECGAPAYIGDLGASPPVISSSKAPGGVRGALPPEADELSAIETLNS